MIPKGYDQDEAKELFLAVFDANGGNISDACTMAKISRQTYYNWYKADPAFAMAIHASMEGLIDYTEGQLLERIRMLDLNAIKLFLEAKAKHRGYGKTEGKVVITGPGGGPVQAETSSKLPEPESIAEWEAQVQEARRKRAQQAEVIDTIAEVCE